MDRESSPDLLKQGCSRSVRLEHGGPGQPHADRIVKLFKSRGPTLPGPLSALDRDHRRAKREYEVLLALSEAGLAVPRPLGLAPGSDGGWEVSMQRIPDAPPLIDLFTGAAPWPRFPARLARELGTLLAQLHTAGVRHADLHAGNVLVGAGPPVAIDFHKARISAHPERGFARAATRNLTQLVSGSREFVSPLFRARFFLAWRRALPAELRAHLPQPAALVRSVEAAGRLLRRDVVHRRRLRWTRDGTACRPHGSEGFVARGVDPALFDLLAGAEPGRQPDPLDPTREVLVISGDERAVRRGWYAAARVFEHQLPCAPPLAVALGPSPWFALALPTGARPATEGEAEALSAAFENRGLSPLPPGSAHVLSDEHGVAHAAGLPHLTPPGAERG